MSSAPLFEQNATAFVPYDDGKFYAAKVGKREARDHPSQKGEKVWYYHVHYTGWNKKYDEWVPEFEMHHQNPSGVTPKGKGPSTGSRKGANAAAAGSGTAAASTGPDESRLQMSIAIPAVLKKQLVDDHDAVKNRSVVPLPKRPCVNEILQQYVEQAARTKGGGAVDDEQQVANGLRAYFDRCLFMILLYQEERGQADGIMAEGTMPSSVYGAEHLLRLFVKLPDVLPLDNIVEEQYKKLQQKLHEVLAFLKEHQRSLFLPQGSYQPLGSAS